jgi:hypothetical protein
MGPYVDGLAERGIAAVAIDLPRRGRSVVPAEGAVDAFAAQVAAGDAVGGHSYGGRVASLVAAAQPNSIAALVLYSYPLHAPGRPEGWDARTAHWSSIRCPVLLLVGDADPFVRLDLLEQASARLARAELAVIPGGRHGLHRSAAFGEVLDRSAAFLRSLG